MAKSALAQQSKQGAARALVRDGVDGQSDGERVRAPTGEYEVSRSACGVGLCGCAGANSFTLSYDAFLQHLTEGRISLIGARR